MTDDDLAAIEKRIHFASDGPWHCGNRGVYPTVSNADFQTILVMSDTSDDAWSDRTFLAYARQDVPNLLAEVQRLKGILHDMRYSDRPEPCDDTPEEV